MALPRGELDLAPLTETEEVPTKQLYLIHSHDDEIGLIGPRGAADFEAGMRSER
jgi:hypothetical protein